MLNLVRHPSYDIAVGKASGTSGNKYALLPSALAALVGDLVLVDAEPMPFEAIAAVHDAGYVASVLAASVNPAIERRIGFKVTPEIAVRAQATPGATYHAALLALKHGYAANGAGGSHHALFESGAGYCVFNDLAIAARRLIDEGSVHRILIVDCDVHQGDGTAVLTAGHRGIATFSIHAERNFPVRKARSTLDVGLPDGVGDDDYIRSLADNLTPLLDRVRPDLVLYQAGVDCHRDDRLGRLALTDQGLIARDQLVARLVRGCGARLASVVGGGYGDDAAVIAARHARSIAALYATMAQE